eukprot:scaffold189897_cov40-Prasinocladus_malaysianus.AAC.1
MKNFSNVLEKVRNEAVCSIIYSALRDVLSPFARLNSIKSELAERLLQGANVTSEIMTAERYQRTSSKASPGLPYLSVNK